MNEREEPLVVSVPPDDEIVTKKDIKQAQKDAKQAQKDKPVIFYQDYAPSHLNQIEKDMTESVVLVAGSQDKEKVKVDSEDYCQVNSGKASFDVGFFLKVFVIQIVLFYLGPVIILVDCFIKIPIIHNVVRLSPLRCAGFFEYFVMPCVIVFAILTDEENRMQFVTLIQSMTFLFLVNSFHLAQIDNQITRRFSTTILTYQDLLPYHFEIEVGTQLEEESRKIMKETALKLNIDFSLLRFKYLQPPKQDEKPKSSIQDDKPQPSTQQDKKAEPEVSKYELATYNVFSTVPVSNKDFFTKYNKFDDDLFKLKYLNTNTRFDQNGVYQSAYATELFTVSKPYRFMRFAMGLLVYFYPLISLVYDAVEVQSGRWYGLIGWYLLTILPLAFIGVIFQEGVKDFNTIDISMQNLSRKLAIERITPEYINQPLRTFDIFDYMTLRSWTTIRKIIINAYDRELTTVSWSLSVVIGFQALGVLFIFFIYLGIINSIDFNDHIPYYIAYGVECSVYLIVLLILTLKSATLNGYFASDRELLRANKEVVVTLFRLYPSLVGKDPLVPAAYIYAEAFKRLHEEFGDEDFEEKMDARLDVLMDTYDTMIDDLEHEEEFNPFKLLGFAVTPNFLKGQVTALVSLGLAFIPNVISMLQDHFAK